MPDAKQVLHAHLLKLDFLRVIRWAQNWSIDLWIAAGRIIITAQNYWRPITGNKSIQ